MKKFLILAPLAILLTLLGCKKVDRLLTFYFDDTQTVRIPANSPLGALGVAVPIPVTTPLGRHLPQQQHQRRQSEGREPEQAHPDHCRPCRPEFRLPAEDRAVREHQPPATAKCGIAYLDPRVPRGVSSLPS
ncbi:MAG: hypothetical protein WKG07_30725 [Hymenobacter sp.]